MLWIIALILIAIIFGIGTSVAIVAILIKIAWAIVSAYTIISIFVFDEGNPKKIIVDVLKAVLFITIGIYFIW